MKLYKKYDILYCKNDQILFLALATDGFHSNRCIAVLPVLLSIYCINILIIYYVNRILKVYKKTAT